MPSQWVIRRNGEGCDILWRDGFSPQERRSRRDALLAEGMTSLEAEVELQLVQAAFTRCNETHAYSRTASFDFILSFAKPGDVVVDHGTMLVCMEPARA